MADIDIFSDTTIHKSIWKAIIVTLKNTEFDVEVWNHEPFEYQDYITSDVKHMRFKLLYADYGEKIAYYG